MVSLLFVGVLPSVRMGKVALFAAKGKALYE